MQRISMIFLLVISLNLGMIQSAMAFVFGEHLLFTNRPDMNQYGLESIPVVAPTADHWAAGANLLTDFPDKAANQAIARKIATYPDPNRFYIDIEALPTSVNNTKLEWAESINKLATIAYWIKSENPEIKLGFYGLLPSRRYWEAAFPTVYPVKYQAWQDRNDYFKPLAEYVDIVYPSLYTFYTDQAGWVRYAINSIQEARKYGKPVYVFLWPYYHDSTALAGQLIPGDYWRLQLETAYQYADGVVIWGGFQQDWNTATSTTDPTNWWYQTLDFINSYR